MQHRNMLYRIVILLIGAGIPTTSSVWAEVEGDFEYNNNGNGTATITNYIGSDTDVAIPREIAGLKVTDIGDLAFRIKNLKSVEIPDSVETVGTSAFSNNKLKHIKIPDSVTNIYFEAFSNNELKSITIPRSVKNIDRNVCK